MTPFPWGNVMQFGLGTLRLAPSAFWAMTPRELAAAWRGVTGLGGAGLSRDRLDELAAQFPDEDMKNGG